MAIKLSLWDVNGDSLHCSEKIYPSINKCFHWDSNYAMFSKLQLASDARRIKWISFSCIWLIFSFTKLYITFYQYWYIHFPSGQQPCPLKKSQLFLCLDHLVENSAGTLGMETTIYLLSSRDICRDLEDQKWTTLQTEKAVCHTGLARSNLL